MRPIMSQPPLISPSPACAASPLDPQQFRAALGMFATGVTIVTARAEDGTLVGLTANSFNSVSLSPPLVLWSLARRAGSMPVFSRGSHYAINILAADQKALAQRFATRDIDRFAVAEGDHVIFVGEVEACSRAEQAQPLIFHGGRYYTELPI